MAVLITCPNVSVAWLRALEYLLDQDKGEAVNLAVCIDKPLKEDVQIRRVLDQFVAARRQEDRHSVELVSTVANTLFPIALYRPEIGSDARSHLYEMEKIARPVSRRRNHSGSYFERLVAWPTAKGEFNQLERVVGRLTNARARGQKRGNAYELSLTAAPGDGDAGGDLRVYSPGTDNRIIGFPCLSHISLSLMQGQLHMTAVYRNHFFLTRAYGNYIGLGRLLWFIAKESGWQVGELMCVSSHATAEIGHRRGFGRQQINALVATCQESIGISHAGISAESA
jgi:hypothetical protein